MSFYNPNFLWALFILAVPLAIHLFNFRRYKKIVFSNVQLLKEIQTESKKSRQLKKWLILGLRMLALASLVIAFAKPYIPLRDEVKGKSLVSVYIDNSESMLNTSTNGPLIEVAKNRAREIINNLPASAEIQILDNSFSAAANKTLTKETALTLIDNIDMSTAANNLPMALQKAQSKKIAEGYASQTIFALTDLQKNNGFSKVDLDSNTRLQVLQLQAEAQENLSIDTVYLAEPITRVGETVKLKVVVSNRGENEASSSLVLKTNNVQQGAESFTIRKEESTTIELSFIPRKAGWIEGVLTLNDVPITFDNTYYFTFYVKSKLGVLHIGNPQRGLEKVFTRDESFTYTYRPSGEIDYSKFPTYDFILLNELESISSGLTEQLKQFVERGGSVLVIPKEGVSYMNFANAFGVTSWGAQQSKGLSIASESLQNPFYKGVYKSIPRNTLLPTIQKLWSINPAFPILKLKDGSAVLGYTKRGNGVLYQLALPLDEEHSTLEKSQLWVVTLLKIALTKTQKQDLAYPLTSANPILLATDKTGETVLQFKKDDVSYIVESSLLNGQLKMWLNEEIELPGNYKVVDSKDSLYGRVALNAVRAESSQEFYTFEEVKSQINGAVEKVVDNTAGVKQAVANIANGKPLWKLFVIAALVFLLVEVLLLRLYKV